VVNAVREFENQTCKVGLLSVNKKVGAARLEFEMIIFVTAQDLSRQTKGHSPRIVCPSVLQRLNA
jgi:hypothetical protein